MIDHLSSSQLTLYMQCSLKYRFQYVDQLPKPFKPSGLAFGSVIHSALAWLHKQRMNGNGVSLEKLFKVLEADWFSQRVETVIRYKEGEDENKLLALAKQMLALYFHQPKKGVQGAEIPFTVPLVDLATGESLNLNLEGFIDLLERDDTIVEYKTSVQTPGTKEANEHQQLTTYSYAFELLNQRPPTSLKLVTFVKTKTPKLIVLETKRTKDDYHRFFYLAKQVVSGIKANLFFPRPSFWCTDCEYQTPCRAWGAQH